jgi:hypothetical protein
VALASPQSDRDARGGRAPRDAEALLIEIGGPSIDPKLVLRMLIVGYCYGIRFERKLYEDVELRLAYPWFCRLDLDDKVPDHSPFAGIRGEPLRLETKALIGVAGLLRRAHPSSITAAHHELYSELNLTGGGRRQRDCTLRGRARGTTSHLPTYDLSDT